MNTSRLFLHIIKFHLLSVPSYLWLVFVLMLALFLPLPFWLGADAPLSGNMSVMPFAYFFILAGQISWGVGTGRAANTSQIWATGSADFLWTRALDHSLLFWAKLTIFLLVCSCVGFALLAPQAFHRGPIEQKLWNSPADESFKARALETPALGARMASIGSNGDRETLVLEHGREAVVGANGLKVAFVTLLTLWGTVVFRYHPKGLFVAFGAFLCGYLLLSLVPLSLQGARVPPWWEFREQVVLYARHAAILWGCVLVVAAAVVWDSRRRYLRLA